MSGLFDATLNRNASIPPESPRDKIPSSQETPPINDADTAPLSSVPAPEGKTEIFSRNGLEVEVSHVQSIRMGDP